MKIIRFRQDGTIRTKCLELILFSHRTFIIESATGCSNGEPSELKGLYLEFLKIPILQEDVFYVYLSVH